MHTFSLITCTSLYKLQVSFSVFIKEMLPKGKSLKPCFIAKYTIHWKLLFRYNSDISHIVKKQIDHFCELFWPQEEKTPLWCVFLKITIMYIESFKKLHECTWYRLYKIKRIGFILKYSDIHHREDGIIDYLLSQFGHCVCKSRFLHISCWITHENGCCSCGFLTWLLHPPLNFLHMVPIVGLGIPCTALINIFIVNLSIS